MSHRINIIVNNDVWGFLKEIPQGERSRTINQALREWARRRRRLDAAAEMDRLRSDADGVDHVRRNRPLDSRRTGTRALMALSCAGRFRHPEVGAALRGRT